MQKQKQNKGYGMNEVGRIWGLVAGRWARRELGFLFVFDLLQNVLKKSINQSINRNQIVSPTSRRY
jgi:hypothetical protein